MIDLTDIVVRHCTDFSAAEVADKECTVCHGSGINPEMIYDRCICTNKRVAERILDILESQYRFYYLED